MSITSPNCDERPGRRDLRSWLDLAAEHGELRTVAASVDPIEELSAITFMASREKGSPALLFENVSGNRVGARVLTNMLAASKERYALAVGLEPDLSLGELVRETRRISQRHIAPVSVPPQSAPVLEVTKSGDEIDLTAFPAPKFWPGDGGQYFGTGSVTLIRHPDTGVINAGVYRQMLLGPRRIGINMVPGRHGAQNCEAWWARGKHCPVVVAHGVDPALFIAATQVYPHEHSEIEIAGGLAGQPLEIIPSTLSDLPMLAHAEMIIEGFIDQGELAQEGPLGEFHGYYSGKTEMRPLIRVEALHHRQRPILTAALMATYPSCEIGEYHAIMRSARVWDNLEAMGVSGVAGVYVFPASSSAAGLMVVSMRQLHAGHVAQVLALAAQSPAAAYCIRWIIAVDDDVDPTRIDDVMWALSVHSNPSDDIDVLRKTWSYRTDPSLAPEARPYGSKALIDACRPHRYRATHPKRTLLRKSMYDKVAARWAEFGLSGAPPAITRFHED